LQNEGRTLIFVNSIKTARRLDGLLRALQFHCRTIHGDLPQKQRLKALETFSSSPRGILVATDVAARGLDIAKIQSVIHYDIARTPQVYVHRSGRTARANTSGKTISFVTPDDYSYHQAIVEYVTGKKANSLSASSSSSMIIPYPVDSAMLNPLRERITLAKKVSILFNFVSLLLLLFLTFLLDFYSKFYSF
jgi:ATP-dependent RNA helicase DDX24/MAK5